LPVQRLHFIRGETSVDCLDLLRTLMLDITAFSISGFKLGAVDTWVLNEPNRLCVASANFAKVALLVRTSSSMEILIQLSI
jgi:hypothetical protein